MKQSEVKIPAKIMESKEDYLCLKENDQLSIYDIKATLGEELNIFNLPWTIVDIRQNKSNQFMVDIVCDKLAVTISAISVMIHNSTVINEEALNTIATTLIHEFVYWFNKDAEDVIVQAQDTGVLEEYYVSAKYQDKEYTPTDTMKFTPMITFNFDVNYEHLNIFKDTYISDEIDESALSRLKLGNFVFICGRMWTICHINGSKYYLGAKEIEEQVEFGDTNIYADSNLTEVASDLEKELTDQFPHIVKECLVDVTVNGVTSKVFVPTKEQMEGGFDYFKDTGNRMCTYNNKADWYWVSTPYDSNSALNVSSDGYLYDADPGVATGFRPFICLDLNKTKIEDYNQDEEEETDCIIKDNEVSKEESYTYRIKLESIDGTDISITTVRDIDGNYIGYTDFHGYLEFIYPADHVTIITTDTDTGYYVQAEVTPVNDIVKYITITTRQPYCGTLELGNVISVCNRRWVVCHIEDGKYYLGSEELVLSEVKFGTTNVYNNSNLAGVAAAYQEDLTKQYPHVIRECLVDMTVNGVTSKVFVPSKEQMDGGFDYFNSDERRIGKYYNQANGYWTSSPSSSNVLVVYYDGDLYSSHPSNTYGFRPFICLDLNKIATDDYDTDVYNTDDTGNIDITNMDGYEFYIKLVTKDNEALCYRDIYDNHEKYLGRTNNHGYMKFKYPMNTVVVCTHRSTIDGYYMNTRLTIHKDHEVFITKADQPYFGDLEVGNIINVFNTDWRVCHHEEYKYYLAVNATKKETRFGSTNLYTDSDLAQITSDYQDKLTKKYPDIVKTNLIPVTVEGLTAKVFAPTFDQVYHEFSYFNTGVDINANRICQNYYAQCPDEYWMATPIGHKSMCVCTDGGYEDCNSGRIKSFRPFICLTLDYWFNINFIDHDNKVLAYTDIYDEFGVKLGVTNRNGNLTFSYNRPNITVMTHTSDDGYYVVSNYSGCHKKHYIYIFTAKAERTYTGTLALGEVVNVLDQKWRVCHSENGKYYLAAMEIIDNVVFGNTNVYADSDLVKTAAVYQKELTKKYRQIVKTNLIPVTVEGVTAKVFAASYEQMNGGFRYFNSDERRNCKYNGQFDYYWTSSPTGGSYVWFVNYGGSFYNDYPSDTGGFRPFICFRP